MGGGGVSLTRNAFGLLVLLYLTSSALPYLFYSTFYFCFLFTSSALSKILKIARFSRKSRISTESIEIRGFPRNPGISSKSIEIQGKSEPNRTAQQSFRRFNHNRDLYGPQNHAETSQLGRITPFIPSDPLLVPPTLPTTVDPTSKLWHFPVIVTFLKDPCNIDIPEGSL